MGTHNHPSEQLQTNMAHQTIKLHGTFFIFSSKFTIIIIPPQIIKWKILTCLINHLKIKDFRLIFAHSISLPFPANGSIDPLLGLNGAPPLPPLPPLSPNPLPPLPPLSPNPLPPPNPLDPPLSPPNPLDPPLSPPKLPAFFG